MKILYIYFFGEGGRRIRLLYDLAKKLQLKSFRRLARLMSLKIERDYGCYLSLNADVYPTVEFRHPVGIFLGRDVIAGKNSVIYQGVSLGGRDIGDWEASNFPSIGEGVVIFSGAKVLGRAIVGDRAVIGANAVVTKDVPSNVVVAGIPARVIKSRRIEN